jgi:CRISPR-associated protein Cmr1
MEKPGKVRLTVTPRTSPTVEATDIAMQDPDAYALWPAKATKPPNPQPPAQRVRQDLEFGLVIDYPSSRAAEVTDTVRAWVLFGGIGGRTRRGCGTLTITQVARKGNREDIAEWLPADPHVIRPMLQAALDARPAAPAHIPVLSGAWLYVGKPQSALNAWYEALRWLKEFRQGSGYDAGDRAREPDPTGGRRPSVSNWPEPDKVRRIMGKPSRLEWAHAPRHNATPVWPRAGFGLPIVGQFQQRSRTGQRWQELGQFEPNGFEIIWRDGSGEHDRLASPLILKPLALANGQFVPCALWLNRAYPQGKACLRGRPDTGAPFDRLVAEGDKALYRPLAEPTLRDAFLTWVLRRFGARRILP